MSETPEAYLRRMFESDRYAPDYMERNPPYKFQAQLTSLGWPSLSEVWRSQGEPPPWEKRELVRRRWAEAWALLQRLHEQYRAAE